MTEPENDIVERLRLILVRGGAGVSHPVEIGEAITEIESLRRALEVFKGVAVDTQHGLNALRRRS